MHEDGGGVSEQVSEWPDWALESRAIHQLVHKY